MSIGKINPIQDQKNVVKNNQMSPSVQLQDKFQLDETETEQLNKVFKQISTINNKKEENDKFIYDEDIKLVLSHFLEDTQINRDEIALMIWEVDDDLDGKISFEEFMMAYKRVIVDLNDLLEPRKFFHLVEFLMYNLFDVEDFEKSIIKPNKRFITTEDCQKLMYIRENRYFKPPKKEEEILFEGKKELYYTDFINRKMQMLMQTRHEMKKSKIDKFKDNWKELNKGDKGK